LTYAYGPWSLVYFLGIVLGFITLAVLANRVRTQVQDSDLHSLPDYIALHFGYFAAVICTFLLCVCLGALLQIQFVVGSQIIATLTNTGPMWWVIALAAVVGLYLWLSGFRGVLATDILQTAVMFITIVILTNVLASGSVVAESVSARAWGSMMPVADAIGLMVLGIFAILGGGDVWQRVYAAKTPQAARNGLLINAFAWLVFGGFLVWLALSISSVLPHANPNTAFVDFITTKLPESWGPVVALLVLSAVISTADVELFVLAVMINKEFARRSSNRASKNATKLAVAGVAGVSALLALVARELVDIYFLVLYLLAVVGPIAFFRLLSRGNAVTALIGLIGGTAVLVGLLATGNMVGWNQLLLTFTKVV
jgi:solute:Na+ symporter, SSS family